MATQPEAVEPQDAPINAEDFYVNDQPKGGDLPEGGEAVLPGVDKVDTGTEFVFRDKRTNEVIGTQPKNIAGKERNGKWTFRTRC